MLAMHPHYQEQIYDEIKTLPFTDDTDITADDLTHLKFLDMFIKETLRLYPSVPYMTRASTSELKLGKF